MLWPIYMTPPSYRSLLLHFPLLEFSSLPPSPLESAEGLEQLRVLENGFKMKVLDTDYDPISVDIPEDIHAVKKAMKGIK